MKLALACVLAAVCPLVIAASSFAQADPTIGGAGIGIVPGAPSSPGAQMPRDNAQPKIGTARIRGRVVAADTGTPLRKAIVRLNGPELRGGRTATTDADGRYEFADLAASRYQLSAAKGSYVTLSYGQRRPFQPGTPLELREGQTLEKVDFALPHGGVITGRVLDEFGDPVADVRVTTLRSQYGANGRRLMPSGRGATTDDIGEFRLFGLAPGQYYVSATLMNLLAAGAEDDRSGYATTFYPAASNQAEAQQIGVGLGEAVSDINITLVPMRTARVSGVAFDGDGKPMRAGNVVVTERSNGMSIGRSSGMIRPDGSFTVAGLTPGTYLLRAVSPPSGPDVPVVFATAPVTVAGEDVTGLQLVVARPVRVTGRIGVAAPDMRQALHASGMRVLAVPLDDTAPMFGGGVGSGNVGDDFTFSLRAAAGKVTLRVSVPAFGWTTRAVRVNGADLTDGLELKSGEDLNDVEIELTNRLSELSGTARDARGDLSRDYVALAFARDPQRWGAMSRYVSIGRPDQDGRYIIRALPAGDYYVVALDYLEPGENNDPEFLQRIRASAKEIAIGEGEAKTIDLTLTNVP